MKTGFNFLLPALASLLLTADYVLASKNIVVILADDHALKVTGAYGNDSVRNVHQVWRHLCCDHLA